MSSSEYASRRAKLRELVAGTRRRSQRGSIAALSRFAPIHELEREWRIESARRGCRAIASTAGRFVSGAVIRSPRESFRYAPVTSAIFALLLTAGSVTAAHVWANPVTEGVAAGLIRNVFPADAMMREFAQVKGCAMRRQVTDASGSIMWVRAANGCGDAGFRSASVENDDLDRFASVLEVFEGRMTGPETLSGLNLVGLARALISLPGSVIGAGPRLGGSNPLQSAIKNLSRRPGRAGVMEKLGFVTRNLQAGAELPTRATRVRFVVEALPLAKGGIDSRFGPIVAGAMVPWVVFDKPDFRSLDDAELCVLAAAAKRQIQVPSGRSGIPARLAISKANEQIRARALARCPEGLARAGLIKPDGVARLREQISQLKFPKVVRTIANPDLQFRDSMPGARHLVRDSLSLDHGRTASRLSVSAPRQALLATRVSQLERALSPKLDDALCLTDCREGQTRADVLSVVIASGPDGRDRIVGAYQSTPGLWHGPTDTGSGQLERSAPHRSLGSLPKILLAPVWIGAGIDKLCLKAFANVHDAGEKGNDCSEDAHYLSVPDALAKSSNLATAEAIRIVGTSQIRGYLSGLGLHIDDRSSERALRRSIALGENAVASPEMFTRAFSAMMRGVDGGDAVAQAGSVFQGDTGLATRLRFEGGDVSFDSLRRVAGTLRAPLLNGKGTLRHMATPLLEMGCSRRSFAGKSGSSDASGPLGGKGVRDRLVIVSARCAGSRRFVVFSMIGSPEVDVPLGAITTADVGRLALTSLRTVINADSNR